MVELILASKSKVRKDILDKNNITTLVEAANVDEDIVKQTLLKKKATPETISGEASSLISLSLTTSSSTFDGLTSQSI